MSKKKSDLLGMPVGTAAHRLRKNIMFTMAQKLGEDLCFRCGCQIETVEEFSVEHKESWQNSADPIAAFFDLENISFSHHSCNSGAGVRHRTLATPQQINRLEWLARKNSQGWKDTVAKRREKRRLARLCNTSVV